MSVKSKTFKGSASKTAKPIILPLEEGEIEAYPAVSGMVTLKFLQGIGSEETSVQMAAIQLYLENSFDDEPKAEFLKIVENPKNGYDLSDLAEIMSWLVEQRNDGKSFEESSE